ncbi:uncharacterized protein [Amphiura filiformis]|uniref:uncharacterized protein n=1 Tax=Amphiura filiformis TaxID=82378 RepID=UPI003B221F0E
MATKLITTVLWLLVAAGSVLSWTLPELEEALEDDLFQVYRRQHHIIGLPCEGKEFLCNSIPTGVCCNGKCHYTCETLPTKPSTAPLPKDEVIPTKEECQTLITWNVCSWYCPEADDFCQVCKEKYGSSLKWDARR